MLFGSPVSAATYSVTFTESGLPSGVTWSVSLSGIGTVFSNTNTVTFASVGPGSYPYSIANVTTGTCSGQCTYHPIPSAGTVVVTSSNVGVSTVFTERYYLTVSGGSGGADGQGWYNTGSVATAFSLGVYGRVGGAGFRTDFYNVDGGSNIVVSTANSVQPTVTMSAPHTVNFGRVQQYQVSLDSGATTALISISPPTLTNDFYWYDTGSAVTLTLNGAWGRNAGIGTRLKSYSLNGGGNVQVATTGAVTVLSLQSITSAESVTTTLTSQYQLTLDSNAIGALGSITPPPVAGDNYWYDSGTAVQYVGQGVYARVAGAGMRTTGWWFDSNTQNPVFTAGTFVAGITIVAPHTLHTVSVPQYQLAMSGTYSLFSVTPPTIAGDNYWYDKGTAVVAVLNGTWNRSGGLGSRMTGYSVNGGQVVTTLTTGQVTALSLAGLTSPQAISVSSTEQAHISLDSTSLAALTYITAPTIAGDGYWYDSGTSVSLTLNGAWARASGTGLRLTSYSLDGNSPVAVASAASVSLLRQVAIMAPQTVTATDQVQYLLTVNGGNSIAYTVGPQIPGDAGWYDSGTTLQVTSAGIYARSAGVGQRVISWNLDGGAAVQTPTTGLVMTSQVTMTAHHVVTFGSLTQYQVSLDQGAVSSLASISAPTIPNDNYWYDSGSPVVIVLNGTGSIGQGARYRLLSYTVNGGQPVEVSHTGLTTVMSLVALISPQTLTAQLATQYQLVISGGNGATTSKASPTGDGWFDNGTLLTVSTPYVWDVVAGQSRLSLNSYNIDGTNFEIQRASSGVYTTPSIAMTTPHDLKFNSATQYYVNLVFTDAKGASTVVPSSVQLDVRGVGTITVQNGSQWFDAGSSLSIVGVLWHGSDVSIPGVNTYVVNGPTTVTSATRVYSATVKVVDLFGLPISGAIAQITFENGTVSQTQSGSDGVIRLGLLPRGGFHATVSNLGVSSVLDGDASVQDQFQVQLPLSLPLIAVVVVVVVLVIAGIVLLLRARRRREFFRSVEKIASEPAPEDAPGYSPGFPDSQLLR
jgi:hypothetical protein